MEIIIYSIIIYISIHNVTCHLFIMLMCDVHLLVYPRTTTIGNKGNFQGNKVPHPHPLTPTCNRNLS